MKPWLSIIQLTFLEVIQSRIFQVLAAATLLAPLFGFVLSSLFLVDIGKVYLDGVLGVMHVLSMGFVLFISAGILARDLEQKVCYLLVLEPSSRIIYMLGRFCGLTLVFFGFIGLVVLSGSIFAHFYIAIKSEFYQSNYAWQHLAALIFLHGFQYWALLGLVFFIFSWATGMVEIVVFASAGLLLSWIFPPILRAMQSQEVAEQVPLKIQSILNFGYNLLPHLTGGEIALALVHGKSIGAIEILWYIVEHTAYAGLLLSIAIIMFSRRDL